MQAYCEYIRAVCPELRFTSFAVLSNTRALPHCDVHNSSSEPNAIIALSNFGGGELWVETQGGTVPLEVGRCTKYGELLDVRREPKFFDPHRLHATFPWKGRRVIIAAYVITRDFEKLGSEQRELLEGLRFHLPVSGITADGLPVRPSRGSVPESGVIPEELERRTPFGPAPAPRAELPVPSASRCVNGSLTGRASRACLRLP